MRDLRLVGVYTNPRHVMHYTSNGEVRQECSLVFAARPVGGELTTSSESSEVRWVAPDELDAYPMHPTMRQRVQHLLDAARRAVHRLAWTSMDLMAWAAGESRRRLERVGTRWSHCGAVAQARGEDRGASTASDRDVLVAAAYLHDVGHAAELVATASIRSTAPYGFGIAGRSELAGLVAHHTGAIFEARAHGFDELALTFHDERSRRV